MLAEGRAQTHRNNNSHTLLLIYVNVALYATCYQIQRPLEPFLVEKLGLTGDSGGEYAKLQSFFSLMQTVGSLVAGPCLDRFGAKGGFIISFLASALSYFLLSNATTLSLLYISKIPTIFQAGYMCAQLAASQATSDGSDRVLALGRLSMSYTIGAILGPAIGGYLGATGDYYLGAKIAVGGSLISVVLALLIPSHTVNHSGAEDNMNNDDVDDEDELLLMGDGVKAESAGKVDVEGLGGGVGSRSFDNLQMKPQRGILQTIMNQGAAMMGVVRIVWLLLSVKIVSGVANSMMSETFPLVLKNIFSLNEQSLGLAIAANSAFNGVVNGLLLAPLVGYAGGDLIAVITVCLTLMTGIALTLSAVSLPSFSPFLLMSKLTDSPISAVAPVTTSNHGLYLYLGLTFVLSIFQYALSTTITGESTSLVKTTQKGTLLGVEHSFFALARIAAPQVGVMLLKMGGVSAVASVSGGVYFTVSMLWNTCKQSLKGKRQAVKTPITVKGAGSNDEGGVRGTSIATVDERKGR